MAKINSTNTRLKQWINCFDETTSSINEQKSKYRLLWIITIATFFCFILAMNILTPMNADDFVYLLIYGNFDVRVTSLSDIIQSQVNHYHMWGGRSIVHGILQMLLLLPPFIIDILNSIVYMSYVWLIYIMIKGKKEHSLGLFILINLCVWFLQPAFGDTILWITGSVNYLWGTSIILLFLLPYRLYDGKKSKSATMVLKGCIFFIGGIITGWTNENTVAGVIVITFLFLVYYRSNNWKIPAWAISGLLGAIIGYSIMILAPGNQARSGEATTYEPLVLAYRFISHTVAFFQYCGFLNILYLIFGIIFIYLKKNAQKATLQLSLLFFIGSIVAIYSMVLSPSFPPRAWFGVITFSIVAVGIIFYDLCNDQFVFNRIKNYLVITSIVAFIFSTYPAFKDINAFYKESNLRKNLAEQAIKENKSSVEFEPYSPQTKFVHDENVEIYIYMHHYYGLQVRFTKSK